MAVRIQPGDQQPPRPDEGRRLTILFGVLVAVLCALGIVFQRDIRMFEAWCSARIIGLFGETSVHDTVVYAWLEERNAIGLDITTSCTVGILGLPVLIAVAVLAWRRKMGKRRLLLAGLAGLGAVFLGNQLRLLAIAFATRWWGSKVGFDFSHHVIGSVISLVTACLGVALVIWASTRGKAQAKLTRAY
ncbi:exosortase/archaeosortase family protein [Amycolatopsis anabasis]|uniref:exosortase/archaeosortase family protein n=1 Tax=Amycolatopsis anabasis TaxID=1840409 RepID=UPI00131CF338|nr:exosortase/archaeosortase family protein [Amycolatopsis anabasis]